MNKRNFLNNAVLLVAVTFLLRLIFTAFRVFVSNIVGAECMGLYQLCFAIYSISVTFATSGINFASMRLIAKASAEGKSQKSILNYCILYAFVFGMAAFLCVFFLSDKIATCILCDARTELSLRIFSFSLPFISLSSALTGYFYAIKKVKISVYARVIECLCEIIVFFVLLTMLQKENIEQNCAAIMFSSAVSEVVGGVYLFVKALACKQRQKTKEKNIIPKIFKISIPTALGSYLKSGLQTIENTLVPIGFRKYGNSQSDALKGYGTLCSMAMPILFFPSFVLSAFAQLLIPEMTEAQACKNFNAIKSSSDFTIKLTLYFSLVVSANFIIFGELLGNILYNNSLAGRLVKIMALLIPFMYLDSIADGLLKGLGEYTRVLKYSIIDAAVSIVLIIFTVSRFGLYGYILVIYISTMLNAVLSISRLLKFTQNEISFTKDIVYPFVTAIVAAYISNTVVGITTKTSGTAVLILSIALSVILFTILSKILNLNVYKTFKRALNMFSIKSSKSNLTAKECINNSHGYIGERG